MLFSDLTPDAEAAGPRLPDQPLAARLRPRSFAEFAGQEHLIAPGKLLRRAIEADRFTAIILYGPPGIGKTTLAELIAHLTAAHFRRLSAVSATVADLRRVVEEAGLHLRATPARRTILFVDELHRFNRAQQDVLLPYVENGTVRLIGATTENPFFCLVGPLVSRAQVFRLEPLSPAAIAGVLQRAVTDERGFPGRHVELDAGVADFFGTACEGDARRALTALEVAVGSTPPAADGQTIRVSLKTAEESMQQKALFYGDDGHYDTISAFIKSMRGSDPHAAVYWLAKMLQAGEDLRFIARRIVIFASEDVGNADPRAMPLALSAMQAVEMIGMPEARIILAQAATYCATCPKSNAAIKAIDQALEDVREGRVQPVPPHLRDSHYPGAASFGHGDGYQYPHDAPEGVVLQDYLAVPTVYYQPVDRGYETRIRERMAYWDKLRQELREAGHARG